MAVQELTRLQPFEGNICVRSNNPLDTVAFGVLGLDIDTLKQKVMIGHGIYQLGEVLAGGVSEEEEKLAINRTEQWRIITNDGTTRPRLHGRGSEIMNITNSIYLLSDPNFQGNNVSIQVPGTSGNAVLLIDHAVERIDGELNDVVNVTPRELSEEKKYRGTLETLLYSKEAIQNIKELFIHRAREMEFGVHRIENNVYLVDAQRKYRHLKRHSDYFRAWFAAEEALYNSKRTIDTSWELVPESVKRTLFKNEKETLKRDTIGAAIRNGFALFLRGNKMIGVDATHTEWVMAEVSPIDLESNKNVLWERTLAQFA